jgi:MFS transporter, SP family, sugar:H+ symporter
MSGSKSEAVGTPDVNEIEAPISIRAYFICAFASFGGILFGYDSGYISGVLGMVMLDCSGSA